MGEIADMMIDAYMFGGARDDEEAMEIGLGLRRPRWGEYDREQVNWRGKLHGDAAERQNGVAPFFWKNAHGKIRDIRTMTVPQLHQLATVAGKSKLTEKLREIRQVIAERKKAEAPDAPLRRAPRVGGPSADAAQPKPWRMT